MQVSVVARRFDPFDIAHLNQKFPPHFFHQQSLRWRYGFRTFGFFTPGQIAGFTLQPTDNKTVDSNEQNNKKIALHILAILVEELNYGVTKNIVTVHEAVAKMAQRHHADYVYQRKRQGGEGM